MVAGVQVDKKPGYGNGYDHHEGAADGLAANIVRKPSLRQQEKAPEGRAPHAQPDGEHAALDGHDTGAANEDFHEAEPGPAPADSRFTESL